MDTEPQIIRAERQTVRFFDGLEVDGYRMPDGQFRVGLAGASQMLGYGREWFGRVLSRGGNTVKALRDMGFSDNFQKVATNSGRNPETIDLRDFNRLIAYAVSKGKKAALALQLALTEVALNDFFRDAFGEPPLSIEEKRELFYQMYAASISPEMWRQMDREEILKLALAGDPLYFPQANDWDNITQWRRQRLKPSTPLRLHLNY